MKAKEGLSVVTYRKAADEKNPSPDLGQVLTEEETTERVNEREPKSHFQLSGSEIFGKTWVQKEKKNSNFFVVLEKSNVDKGIKKKAEIISVSPLRNHLF